MIVFLIVVCICLIASMNVSYKGLDKQYLAKKNTQVIKGVFVICVFLSHVRTYSNFDSSSDLFVIEILDYLGQIMVALFLFYSGYGVFESIKKKGQKYIADFPKNRIGKTFFDFSIAIILYFLLAMFTGEYYSIQDILLSLTGWTSIGNSNWYMFAIFSLYILTYFCFSLVKNKSRVSLCFMIIGSFFYIVIVSQFQPTRFTNTYLCYIAGMLYSYFKEKIDDYLKNNIFLYYVFTILIVLTYIYIYPNKGLNIYIYNLVSILFCLCVTFISMKITFKSKILFWFGEHLFWIYIIQRIPMLFLEFYRIVDYPYLFLILSFIITNIMALYLQLITTKIKKIIWNH
ncbi:MAG: acyltransferase family protein [Longibaculum sp.]